MPHWSASIRYRAIGMMEGGLSVSEISFRLHVPVRTLYRWITRFRNEGEVERMEGTGRPSQTSRRSDRRLVRLSRRNPFASSSQLLMDWGEQVSSRTVRRRLRHAGLYSRRPLTRRILTPQHRQARLQWAMCRCHFREAQWRCIVFTDESRFVLRPVDGRTLVWRMRTEVLRQDLVEETTAFGGGSVMVWGAICCDGRSPLVVLRGTVTGESYRQILSNHLLPWAEQLLGHPETEWRLQDDNATPHRCQTVRQFLESSNIRRIDWPARSTDLNPMEHMWDELGRRVRQRGPTSLARLATVLKEEWNAIPQQVIRHIIHGMPRRVHQVILTREGYTPY